jgi:hypothetical protein
MSTLKDLPARGSNLVIQDFAPSCRRFSRNHCTVSFRNRSVNIQVKKNYPNTGGATDTQIMIIGPLTL